MSFFPYFFYAESGYKPNNVLCFAGQNEEGKG